MLRHAAVAGHFYPGTAEALKRQVRGFIISAEKTRVLGILSPHAGLIYSGPVAGAVYSSIDVPDTAVLIGPNHTGLGAPVSIMCDGAWETPLGPVDIDGPLARAILSRSPRIQEDSLAHVREHSLEVQLPFLQYLKKRLTIVPLQMLDTRLETCLEVGRAVGEAIRERSPESGAGSQESRNEKLTAPNSALRKPHDVLIIASSDMTHYESAASAKEKDFKAIHNILALDPEGLYSTVKKHGITMCGYGPAVAMLAACRILGASKAKLIRYANSGEVSGDYEQVVGYAGIIVM
jgi:predicted class III extradiol MEMO1 family dioxygenase